MKKNSITKVLRASANNRKACCICQYYRMLPDNQCIHPAIKGMRSPDFYCGIFIKK